MNRTNQVEQLHPHDQDEQLHPHDQLYQPELQHLRMIKTNKVSKQHDKIMSIKSALNKVENVNKR